MEFTKMQGCGNDYVYIDGQKERIENKPEFVRKMSNRNFGVGSDGVIFINASSIADFEMEMYNADGSRSEMCGNGIRCVGKFVYDKGLTDKTMITVESFGNIKYLELFIGNGEVETVTVNMGAPILEAVNIPVVSKHQQVIAEEIIVEGSSYEMTCVSMGNPHAVVFMENLDCLDMEKIGSVFEHHSRFPNRVNTEFVQIIDDTNVKMRVWERGTGETLACGTGTCAVAVACVLNGLTKDEVTVHVLGGALHIKWDREKNLIYMTGPAVTVFEGRLHPEV